MTIISRRLFTVNRTKMLEAAELAKAEAESFELCTGRHRLYIPIFAPEGLLAMEREFDSLAQYERNWAAYSQRPETVAFVQKWSEIQVGPDYNQIYHLAASSEADGSENTIAVRWVRYPRPGCRWDVVAANVEEFVKPGVFVARIAWPETGWLNEQVLEIEYESLPAYLAAVAEWGAKPTTPAYHAMVGPLLADGGTTEVWQLV